VYDVGRCLPRAQRNLPNTHAESIICRTAHNFSNSLNAKSGNFQKADNLLSRNYFFRYFGLKYLQKIECFTHHGAGFAPFHLWG
jgi:hypothetical protein